MGFTARVAQFVCAQLAQGTLTVGLLAGTVIVNILTADYFRGKYGRRLPPCAVCRAFNGEGPPVQHLPVVSPLQTDAVATPAFPEPQFELLPGAALFRLTSPPA
jgi:hypothetical protein